MILAGEAVGVGQIHQPDRAPADLVLIGRADASLGRADALDAALAMRVEIAIDGENQRNVLGDLEIVRAHLDPLRAHRLDLARQMIGVEHDAVADHRQLARPHDARGQQRQLEHLAADDERMPRVVSALETDDHIRRDRQPIDDFAFPLVAPLGADHYDVRHSTTRAGFTKHARHELRARLRETSALVKRREAAPR